VFNVRLGWWMRNTRTEASDWRPDGPPWGCLYYLAELFGQANDRRNHVYLSDGGHFENLAVYELLRRRCAYIVCVDGEEDHGFTFDGLAGLVRKARVDFGIEIDIKTSRIRPPKPGQTSTSHHAMGDVHYPARGAEKAFVGKLIYLKASVTGDEPADVRTYAATHTAFPHQSTADQFFSESQFESYRRLGLHVAENVFGIPGPGPRGTVENLFAAAAHQGQKALQKTA
jgi:hypothetical protein